MKAREVLRRYKDGRRDFSGESLRGQSFKGKSLVGANFSKADIRGANFTNANLRGAKFCEAKAGLQKRWAVFLVGVSWLLSALSGIFSVWTALMAAWAFEPNEENFIVGIVFLIVFAVFLIVAIHKGLAAGSLAGALAGAVAVPGALVVAVAVLATGEATVTEAGEAAGAFGLTVTRTVALALAATVTGAGAVAVPGAVPGAFALAGALAVVLAAAGVETAVTTAGAVITAVAVALALALLGAYLGWRSLKGDERDAWIRAAAIAFAATGGTSFRNADLTDADFTGARLKSTDLRKANLTRTRWRNANKLDRVRPGMSYLQDAKVRELVITGDGKNQEYDHLLNLQGINLQGANLVGADFTGSVLKNGTLQGANLTDAILIGADLNGTNLQDTNMSRAMLKQAQLDGADLTGATLTGAYIEDWGITAATKLDGVTCRYIYMRLPTTEHPEPWRKPDNMGEEFGEGDFADFIKPLQGTLDLYHNRQVDPRAVSIAFNELSKNHPEANLSIATLEVRGENNDKFLLRVKAAEGTNYSELNSEYFNNYNQLKSLPQDALLYLIAEKDNQIRLLTGQVDTALKSAIERPSNIINTESYINQGDTISDQSSNISINNVTGSDINGIAAGQSTAVGGENLTGVATGDINGTVTNTINQLSDSDSPEAQP
ncbi:MAG: pentapeptide repeat-containing protein [Symploca sp. SIO2D2]|nr:pentapeptide repeat-containing protein [Symploca sp. SIO2D2]